ncbi:fibrinogen C domain-containing protein 1 [Seriola aureovittata]|uniref:fibrinogen C domain-containing protein 1 n=1 Tax=Seriola aureovittata TaxID=2871759 RepID=UPI0024BD6206|nr:fibrinogen C domain-containing protein 1 [Seriola aureovittata]
MMLNDQWTIMNNSSSELDSKQPKKHKRCCSFLLWSVVMLIVIAAIVTATVTILYLNQYPLPFISRGGVSSSSPVISTNPKESGALVTVSRVTAGEPISIFLDPNCPDYSENFLRWEALQSSLLRALTNHNTEDWQEMGLVQKLAEELKVLSGHAHNLRLEADFLKRGQVVLDQRLDGLQSEQSRIIQVLSDTHSGVLKLAAGFSDSLLSLQRETDSLRRLKGELQKDRVVRPRDCSDVMASGISQDGVYSVFPTHDPDGFMVYCDMTTDGGGWTVIQRREDGSVNFFRGWDAYRDGFGMTTGEHWLGLQRIYSLTRSGGFELRIDMADYDNATAFARYADFSVGRDSVNPEEDGYPLTVDQYSGTAGDSLLKHSGMRFTTKDRDQDQSENNCAAYYQGAWWYRNCHTSNLNGQYLRGGHASYADGVEWSSWTGWQYSLRFTEMKIRPNARPES